MYFANIIGFELKPKKHIIHVHSNIPSLKKLSLNCLLNPRKIGIYYEQKKIHKAISNLDVTFLTIAEESFSYINKNVGFLGPKTVLQHNAINLDRFKKDKTNINKSSFSIISIARLVDYKGHDLTIDVALELKRMNFEFEISIFRRRP